MRSAASLGTIVLLFAVLVGCAKDNVTGSVGSQEPRAARGQVVEEHHWSYSGPDSPEHWGDLSHEWLACTSGTGQSPINIPELQRIRRDPSLQPLMFDYELTPLEPFYNGHAVQLNYRPGSFLYVGNDMYELEQIHFHTPGEHTVTGGKVPMEVHFVHENSKGEYAVVAVLVRDSQGSDMAAAYAPVINSLPKESGKPVKTGRMINAKDLVPNAPGYIAYTGSLTTPPCSEKVHWFVLGGAARLNKSDIEKLHAITQDNARPVMPLNNRDLAIGPGVKVR